jgi:hypothetical protein
LWTSVTTSSTWAEATNIYVPANGQSQDISFPNEASGSDCYIDLKFQFKGGTVKQIGHIDLCYIVSVTIDVDDDGTVTYKLSHK